MKGRRPRGLYPEEEALWNRVRESATPLKPIKSQPLARVVSETPKDKGHQNAGIQSFRIGEKAPLHQTKLLQSTSAQAPGFGGGIKMDRKGYQRMKRGKLQPEARIDLHGMTVAQAHPALHSFILGAHGKGMRLVLVITGKGRNKDDFGPIPLRKGVLRHQVPQWLRSAPLGPIILQVSEAHDRHGGGGALYVYLKRRRAGAG